MGSSEDDELPFFPSYESTLYNNDKIRVVWFEPPFSQSHYNSSRSTNGSNACTIIAILVAAKVHFNRIKVPTYNKNVLPIIRKNFLHFR